MTNNICTLCLSEKIETFFSFRNRNFYKCKICNLVFQSLDSTCSSDDEKNRYLDHNNSELSAGYKEFLYNIINPIKKFLSVDKVGLDFGSGPYPMMSKLLSQESYIVDSYDPYFKKIDLSSKKYDFVILCEVIEHFNNPNNELLKIRELLNDNGFVFIQTSLLFEGIDFEKWYYKDDITHVSFFNDKVIDFICLQYGFKRLKSDKESIIILQLEDN